MTLHVRRIALGLGIVWILTLGVRPPEALAQGQAAEPVAAPEMTLVPDEMAAGVPDAMLPEGTEQPPAALAAPPPPPPRNAIAEAWHAPAESLEERVWRTRRTALERGVWNLDGAARALLGSSTAGLEVAEAAVRLAPDLPAGQMELAGAIWLHGESPLKAIRTAFGSLAAFPRHPEGALWLGGSLLQLLAFGLMGGGALAIVWMGLMVIPHAAHDLGDLFSRSMPAFGRAALVLALLLIAPALGEGLLAVVLGLAGIAVLYGSRRQRFAIAVAAAALVAGAHPVARLSGAALEALPNDLVAQAALATSRGLPLDADVARLEAAQETDLLARQGVARMARRAGAMGTADALYQSLVRERPDDVVILTNAANVRLHLGHMEAAFELYDRALEVEESPRVLYNLSQAYGRAFQVDELTRALQLAQALDGDLVADLTRLQGTQPEGFVVDLPIRNRMLWERVLDPRGGERFAAELRAPFAPGRVGAEPVTLLGAFALVMVVGLAGGIKLRASFWCARCGRRVCPRCHPEVSGGELCGGCNRLFYQPERTDRDLRLARIDALRAREKWVDKVAWAVSIAIPGAAGVLARRPLRSVVGAICFVIAAGALVLRDGAVPDPLVAGAAGPFAFLCVAGVFGLVYAIVVATSLSARRSL